MAMSKPATQAERLAVLEAEAALRAEASNKAMGAVAEELKKINDRLDTIESDIRTTNSRLSAYENKGKGFLIAAGLFGAGAGASVLAALAKLMGWFVK
jgi:tetrahydromethanopterin S-methyltransferase subunit G